MKNSLGGDFMDGKYLFYSENSSFDYCNLRKERLYVVIYISCFSVFEVSFVGK